MGSIYSYHLCYLGLSTVINFFVSFSCKMNGVISYGNTVFHSHVAIMDMNDVMQVEREIKELFEKNNPGQQLDNACILNIVRL